MKFYTTRHAYYCGIDLHTRFMYLCIIDNEGTVHYHKNHRARGQDLLRILKRFGDDVVVCCECTYSWYWLADLCHEEGIPFVLGHATYMRAIHGAKTKNDKLDSEKIARLLAGHMIPQAYVYPKGMRETRALLRRRMAMVNDRAQYQAHLVCLRQQYNLPALDRSLIRRREKESLLDAFSDQDVQRLAETDVDLLTAYDPLIGELESYIEKRAAVTDPASLSQLRSIPGVGKTLSLVMLYEIHDIARFPTVKDFCSYARLIGCQAESNGKKLGVQGRKVGNPYLKWAFSEAAMLFLSRNALAEKYKRRMENKHGKARTLNIVAHRLGIAVYHMLNSGRVFDIYKFLNMPHPQGAGRKEKNKARAAVKECKMKALV